MMRMKNKCTCDCCSTDSYANDYDDIIEQLKETRDSIDKMIQALEHRKVKDNVINQILNTEYEDEDADVEEIKNILDNVKINTYTIPFDKVIRYPYKYYPYFKYQSHY